MKKLYVSGMRKIFILLLVIITGKLAAQPYGNSWIGFDASQQYSTQQYWKIKVWKDGMYRIKPSELFASQFPQSVDPRTIQVFYKGVEQFVFISGEADGTLDPSDYIEFYGVHNNGSFDSLLYLNSGDQGNTAKSFFSDTSTYFVTINPNGLPHRRMVFETKTDYANYTPETFFIRKVNYTSTASYLKGYQDIYSLSLSDYTLGEGFTGPSFNNISSPTFSVPLSTPNSLTFPLSEVQMRICGANHRDHLLQLEINNYTYLNTIFQYYQVVDTAFVLTNTPTGSSFDFVYKALPNPDGSIGYMTIDHVFLKYPHTFSFAGESAAVYEMPAKGNFTSGYTRWDISNLNFSNPILLLQSGDTLKKIALSGSGNSFQALLPTYGFDKNCWLMDSVATTFTNDVSLNYLITPVVASNPTAPFARFTNFAFDPNAEYLIITHKSLWNAATNYKNYRENNPYNSYKCLMAESNELYDQFAYGIVKHPLGIKNFVRYTEDNFSIKPNYLFLIGKSIKNFLKLTNASNPNYDSNNLVPTFGEPPSDLMLVSRLKTTDTITKPAIAVGRLSALTEQDVNDYLEKVQAYELQPRAEWMKNVLHFAGGTTLAQRQDLEGKLNNYAAIISDSAFGGYVRTLSKTVTDPIQIALSNNLQKVIDSGVTLMTFYAHAGASSFDIATDDPATWHNQNRYPLILGNSCYVGDAHLNGRAAAENFVMQKNKGAIGFVGSASVNYIENLYPYSYSFYEHLSKYNYGKTLGTIMLKGIDTTWSIYNNGFYTETVTIGMNLQGDPALIINAAEKPDLEIQPAYISFNPTTVSAIANTFEVVIVVKNLGLATNNPYVLEISRKFNNGNTVDTIYSRPFINYTDTIRITYPVDQAQGPGFNTFTIKLDPNNAIPELNDSTNNTAEQQLYILSNDVTPIYPARYAIVPNTNFQLKASTVNQFAPITRYVFEMDTTDTYSSPLAWHDTLTAAGGYLTKNLPFAINPNTVYYWRVSRDSVFGDPVHPSWSEASFIHIPAKTGWSQAHFYQFKNDAYTNIIYDRTKTKWNYVTTKSVVKAETNNKDINFQNTLDIQYFINNVLQDYSGCSAVPAIMVALIDPLTLSPLQTDQPDTYFGNYNSTGCRASREDKYFIFQTSNATQMDSLVKLFSGKLPDGIFALVYSYGKITYSTLPANVKQVLAAAGSDSINNLQDNQAWILFTQIGNPAIAHEVTSQQPDELITLIDSLGGNWSQGYIVSEKIGPANKWETLEWSINNVEALDTALLQLWGIDTLQKETLLMDSLYPSTTTVANLFQTIDAKFYKYLYFKIYLRDDSIVPDPAQLNKWQIYFQEVPEAMVNPNLFYSISNAKPMQGDSVTVQMAIQNISGANMDSMLVDFYIYNASNQKINLPSQRYKALTAGDTLHCKVSFSTLNLPGANVLWIEANPQNDQPEQYHFNNFAQVTFDVQKDITNPILDVTFDGIHILNGDIVSAKPNIEISLKDENKYLLLNDTNDFVIYFYPDGQRFNRKRLYFESAPNVSTNTALMQWKEATGNKNTFRINYAPVLPTGVYTIEVNAQDRSDNQSGANQYTINFEVDTNATITELINYPNPFSTSTRFVFTLTGSEIPQYFKIQIMTVTGKVIREITKDELGPLHIGRNMTQYAWDGKDQYGDQLANGVYLYRVQTQLNGSSVQHRETAADQYFKKGWGKMYLMK